MALNERKIQIDCEISAGEENSRNTGSIPCNEFDLKSDQLHDKNDKT